jgi:Ni,Fe-hydrogenase I large subunit
MRSTNIAIDVITKIEGSAGLEVVIEDDAVRTCDS